MKTEHFSFNTCRNLIKREFIERRSFLFWILAVNLFFASIFAIPTQTETLIINISASNSLLSTLYWVIGVFIASQSFWEFSNNSTTSKYLLLPASTIEKIMAKIIFYILGWLILSIIIWVIACLTVFISHLLFISADLKLIYITCINGLISIIGSAKSIFLIQLSIIFASCYLRKNVLLKLILIYGVLMIFIFVPVVKLFKLELISLSSPQVYQFFLSINSWLEGISTVLGVLILLLLLYLRLRETEAK